MDAAAAEGESMKVPLCKLCETRHWTYEGHVFQGELRNQTPTVTKSRDETVTETVDNVTSTVRIAPKKMKEEFKAGRMNFTHGGARDGSGRKRQFETNACRQKAYRERSRG